MSETENAKEKAVELFLHADRKIENVVADVGELIKADLGLGHKMDLVIQAQTQLKEGFDHSRTTGHKTWEAVQTMSATMEKLAATVAIIDGKAIVAAEKADRVDKRFDKIIVGIFVTVFLSVFACVMAFLWHYKP